MKRVATVLAGLALVVEASLGTAGAESTALTYEIRLGGFVAGAVQLNVQFNSEGYRIAARTESRGLVDALVGFRSDAHTEGTRRDDMLSPVAHAADNLWRGDARRVRIRYGEHEGVAVAAHPPPELDDRDAVPQMLMAGTLDPLSASLHAALAARAGRPCEGRLDVFDGRRRYVIHFEERRREAEALRCRLRLERIAGMSHDPWLPILRPIETAELWIAAIRPGLPPAPLRLQADTALGAAVVRLTTVDGAPP